MHASVISGLLLWGTSDVRDKLPDKKRSPDTLIDGRESLFLRIRE